MSIIYQQIFVLYIFLLLGWMFGKIKKGLAEHSGMLSFLLINLFLPCKVFKTFSQNFTVHYISSHYNLIIASVVMLTLLVIIAIPVSKLLTKQTYQQKVYRYSMTISNYAYFGYALTEQLFGAAGLTNLILFCIPFVTYTYSLGYIMLTGGGSPFKRLLNPMVGSIVLGIAVGLSGISIPDAVNQIVNSSSACVGPLGMLLTGITLSGFSLRELVCDKKAYIVTAIRLLAIPAVVFGVCRLFSLELILPWALLVASMPCGLNTIIFPKLWGEDCKTGARLALISDLASCVTLPIWLSVITNYV